MRTIRWMQRFSELWSFLVYRIRLARLRRQPPLLGGDGTSPESAVFVNCASMTVANRLMDRFIGERHGKKDTDWTRHIEFFTSRPGTDDQALRCIGIQSRDGDRKYYFDVSRPMHGTINTYLLLDHLDRELENK